jgi:hypothetical protein
MSGSCFLISNILRPAAFGRSARGPAEGVAKYKTKAFTFLLTDGACKCVSIPNQYVLSFESDSCLINNVLFAWQDPVTQTHLIVGNKTCAVLP